VYSVEVVFRENLYVWYVQDEVDEVKSPVKSDTQLSVSDALSTEPAPADIFQCNKGYSVPSNSSASSIFSPVLSKDSMLADPGGMEDRVTIDSSVDREAEDNEWFSCKQVFSDDLGRMHDGLDMVDIADCPSEFAGESACNTIDFDTIIDLGLNATDVLTKIRSKDCEQGQSEVISGQSYFTDITNQPADLVTNDNLVHYVNDIQDKDALNTAGSFGIKHDGPDAVATKTVTMKPTSMLADVPSSVASSVPQLSSVKCDLATSFLTPRTPTHSQGLPTYATHFSFSSPDEMQRSPVLVQRPKTPVVSVSLPVRAHAQLSPHAPYTPDTPSIFQFPSPNQSPASSTGCSPAASRHSKRHTANYHPYSSPSASTSSPRCLNQQQASAEQFNHQRRLEMEVAEAHSEIDQYVRQLHQADLQRKQQTEVHDACRKEMSSKLFVAVPEEAGMLSDADTGNTTNASYGQACSPLEEVIQILVAEHFGVTVPSKFLQGELKQTGSDPKVRIELTNQPATTDGSEQHPVTEEFRNPGTLPASKRKRKPEPLVIPASVSNFGFRSQLRSPKLPESGYAVQQSQATTPPPYTPPPMISPARTGSGVFWTLHGVRQIPAGPSSAPPCHKSFPCMFYYLILYLMNSNKTLCF